MRKNTTKPFMLHKVIIPVAVVASSIAILSLAYWYHEQELSKELLNTQINQGAQLKTQFNHQSHVANSASNSSTPPINLPSRIRTRPATTADTSRTPKTSTSSKKLKTSSPSKAQASVSSAKPDTKHPDSSTPPKQVAPKKPIPPSVSGGVVKPIAIGQVPDTTVRSKVVQFGSRPQTTGFAGSLKSNWGSSLTLPSSIPTDKLLGVSLQAGVLWAIIPPSQIQSDGQLGLSENPTNLMYTPFPDSGAASLMSGAIRIAQLQPAATSTNPTSGIQWLHHLGGGSNNIDSSAAKKNVIENAGSTATGLSNQSSKTSTNLYLSSLYADASGGVIAINSIRASGRRTQLVYQFNEATRSVKQLAQLPNGGRTYSWLGVASDHIYWGIRNVNPVNPSTYTEQQYMYTIPADDKTKISLGTWASTVYVNGDHLVFQVKNTTTWKQFIPSPTATPTSTTQNTNTNS